MEESREIRLPWSDWKIVKYLGGGAYGKVYEIERNISGIQEKAALKIISRPKDGAEIESYYDNGYDLESIAASYESEIKNYVQEYKLLKELQGQSNIVSCDDFTVIPHSNGIGGDIFIRMELLTSLQQILRDRLLSEKEIIKLGKDIAHALILCEKKHIIHRDIKPMNVMVSQFGDFKLGDFGVSRIMDHTTFATAMGTPEYQAPEVVHMEKYGHTADIYSLGIMLYWLLNNRKMPFIGADERLTPVVKEAAMEKRYRGEKLPAPQNGSAQLKQIVLKACEYRPQDRYASAQAMYDALDALQNGTSGVNGSQQERTTAAASGTVRKEMETVEMGGTAGTIGKAQGSPVLPPKKREDDWGGIKGTIGKAAAKSPAGQPKAYDAQKTAPAAAYYKPQKQESPKKSVDAAPKKSVDAVPKKQVSPAKSNEEIKKQNAAVREMLLARAKNEAERIDMLLSFITVEKETPGNKRLDTFVMLLFFIGGGVAMSFGIIWLGIILICLGIVAVNDIGGTDFKEWMKCNKEKVSNIDELIKENPEFAKRLYYEKCQKKFMLDYMAKLNPAVVKEIKGSLQKK